MVKHQNPEKFTRSWRRDEQSVIRRFPIGIVAAQTPPDQARQIELQKEAMRKAEAQRIHEAIDQERERLSCERL
jgi:hypothetical protein